MKYLNTSRRQEKENLKLDESPFQIRNPKSQIGLPSRAVPEPFESNSRSRISDLKWAFVQFQNSLSSSTGSRLPLIYASACRMYAMHFFTSSIEVPVL